jgi:hypothetical protein
MNEQRPAGSRSKNLGCVTCRSSGKSLIWQTTQQCRETVQGSKCRAIRAGRTFRSHHSHIMGKAAMDEPRHKESMSADGYRNRQMYLRTQAMATRAHQSIGRSVHPSINHKQAMPAAAAAATAILPTHRRPLRTVRRTDEFGLLYPRRLNYDRGPLFISGGSRELILHARGVGLRRHCSTAELHEMLSHLGGVAGTGRLTRLLAVGQRRSGTSHAFALTRIPMASAPSRSLVMHCRRPCEIPVRLASFEWEDFVYG